MRGRVLLAPMATIVALLTACSGPSPAEPGTGSASAVPSASASATPSTAGETTEALLARSQAALVAAASFRTKSKLTFGEFTIVTNSIHVGDKVKGTQTVAGLKTQFVRIGDDLYINGTEAYWTNKVTLDSLGQVIYKWVKVDATDPTHEPLAPLYDKSAFQDATASGTLTRTGTATVAGQTATVIKSGEEAVIHIAAEGEPYPLRVEASMAVAGGTAKAVIEFSEFGTITTVIKAPTGHIIDLTKR